MGLEIAAGHATLPGRREHNEDFCGLVAPVGIERDTKGIIAVVADGVAGEGGGGGRHASEYTVRGLLADYYATPDTWAIPYAVDKVLGAVNRWLVAQSTAYRNTVSLATTLSALVLRGRRYVVAHVGDSRIYRLRDGEAAQLTRDHVWDHPDLRHVLTRAVGLDAGLVVDYADGDLAVGDRFVLLTDGVWSVLSAPRIARLAAEHDPAPAAQALCQAALDAGAADNVTALVVRIDALPEGGLRDSIAQASDLAPPPPLETGACIDRFEVIAPLHVSRATRLYKVRDRASGRTLVLKTLNGGERADATALLTEEWMARRVCSQFFPEVMPLRPGERSALYYVMSHHAGHTLQAALDAGRHFSVAEAVACAVQIVKGVAVLHRLNILHRDVKPANVLQGDDGIVRILDLGVAFNGGVDDAPDGVPGTPSYMAPEVLAGQPASVRSDLYAIGVTLYQLLTRRYPYGEIEPFQHPRFGDAVPPTRYRRDVPAWLESIVLKAVARDPKRRFETAEEFLLALQRGPQNEFYVPRRTAVVERDPVRLWAGIAVASIVLNLALVYALLIHGAR
ncbi:MAG: protein kinase domain-containing protein [Rhodospirillaceae bacterium]